MIFLVVLLFCITDVDEVISSSAGALLGASHFAYRCPLDLCLSPFLIVVFFVVLLAAIYQGTGTSPLAIAFPFSSFTYLHYLCGTRTINRRCHLPSSLPHHLYGYRRSRPNDGQLQNDRPSSSHPLLILLKLSFLYSTQKSHSTPSRETAASHSPPFSAEWTPSRTSPRTECTSPPAWLFSSDVST